MSLNISVVQKCCVGIVSDLEQPNIEIRILVLLIFGSANLLAD